MTHQIPTIEDIREAYQFSGEGMDFKRVFREQGVKFDDFMAAHDAEVARNAAANALREAVHLFEASPVIYTANTSARSRLADEADRIEREVADRKSGDSQ